MIFELVVSIVFLFFNAFLLRLVMQSTNLFAIVHCWFFYIFTILLHVMYLISNGSIEYEETYYLLVHLVLFLYLLIVTLSLLLFRITQFDSKRWVALAVDFEDRWLSVPVLAWLLVKGYLVAKYGFSALSFTRNVGGEHVVFQFTWWETAILSYVKALFIGAIVVFLIKAVSIVGYYKRVHMMSVFILLAIVFVVMGESPMGGRRFILMLALLYLALIIDGNRVTISEFFVKNWKVLFAASFLLVTVANYYQVVRTNYNEPKISYLLRSGNGLEILEGVVKVVVTIPDKKFDGQYEADFFRQGPFELIYNIVAERFNGSDGTDGALIRNSIEMVIPRVILGPNKTAIGVDQLLAERMDISTIGNFRHVDVPTSLLSIFVADIGLVGALVAPLVTLVSLISIQILAKRGSFSSRVFYLYSNFALLSIA
jgi:hypothetical protein